MPIQDFVFESDSLDDLERMLTIAVDLIFPWRPAVVQKMPAGFGRTQYPSHSAARMLSYRARSPLSKQDPCLKHWADQAGGFWTPIDGKVPPLYKWICAVSDRYEDEPAFNGFHRGGALDAAELKAIASFADRPARSCQLIKEIMTLVKAADRESFLHSCYDLFCGEDGSTGAGYRLECAAWSGRLTVSFCHIYYPK